MNDPIIDLMLLLGSTLFATGLGWFAWRSGNQRATEVARAVAAALAGRAKSGQALIRINQHDYCCELIMVRRGENAHRECLRISRRANCPASFSVRAEDAVLRAVVQSSISAVEQTLTACLDVPGYRLSSPSGDWVMSWLQDAGGRDAMTDVLKHAPLELAVRPDRIHCNMPLGDVTPVALARWLAPVLRDLDKTLTRATQHRPDFHEAAEITQAFDRPLAALTGPFLMCGSAALMVLPLVGWSTSMPGLPIGAELELTTAAVLIALTGPLWHRRLKRSAAVRDDPRSVYLGGMILIVTGSALWGIGLARPLLQWWLT